jgi:hypothetical protein
MESKIDTNPNTMKKIFFLFILFYGCFGILEAQNIWEPLNLPGSLKAVNAQGDLFCIKYAYPSNLQRSQDNGKTWETVYTGQIGNCIIGDKGRVFLINDRIVYYSDDNGDTWSQTSPINNEGTGFNYFSSMNMCSPSNDTLVGWTSPYITWTFDGGMTWDSTHMAFMEDQEITSLLVNENGDVYASIWHHIGPNIGVYHSTLSDMRNWELVAFEGIGVKKMVFDPEGNVLCGVEFDGAFSGFEHVPGFYAFWAHSIDVADNGIIYKPSFSDANTAVLAYSLDHGEHFYNTVENLPISELVPTGLSFGYDNHLYFVGNGQYWRSIPNSNDLPSTFSLLSDWYYEILNDDGSITYQHLECVGDTLFDRAGKRPKVIVRSNTHYDRGETTEVTHEYVYEEDGVIYWWNKDLQEFTTLYNLQANAGDEWEIKFGTESLTMHVDAVEDIGYEGKTYRALRVSDPENLFSGTIVCGIGHLTSFFPERLMTRGRGYRMEGMRCYWIDGELVFKIGDEDCDEIYIQLHNDLDEPIDNGFAVYPNPTHGVLFVETTGATFLPDHTTYRITNLMGQTLMQGHISDEKQQIDMNNLPAGMYFISVGGQTVKFVVK